MKDYYFEETKFTDYVDKIHRTFSMEEVYLLYEKFYNYYDDGVFTEYQLDIFKDAFWERLKTLKHIKRVVDNVFVKAA